MNRVQWDRWNQWKMKLCSKKWSKVRIIIMLYEFTLTSDAEPYSVDSIKRTVHLAFHGLFSLLKILFTNSKQYF